MIETNSQLAELLPKLAAVDRIAVDTEADSLHCYFEKLCLIQISVSGEDHLVDPLAQIDLAPLAQVLAGKEIVLQGADFDLRLLRRSFGFVATRIFDTVIAARLLGIRSFSLAALVEKFFGVTLAKGSQKANWARRPLPQHMAEYAKNDTHYLLPLAEKLEEGLRERGRLDWFRQSCERALEQASVQRTRDDDEPWRISGSGKLGGRACAVLRELWQWRDKEAQAADRPAFHVLQNHLLIRAAEEFAAGEKPDYRHFSARRRQAFREAAERGLQLTESEWPVRQKRRGTRPTREMERAAEELRRRRDAVADAHGLEPSLIAPRGALDAVAADGSQSKALLVPWQRDLLEL
ncbi:MAG TPA: ribonuclease D [Chthoniobacterales bacterium]|nr:ribonuclease D [Chthoniobacterales bacterium]